jgi:hypothetical protein
MTMADENISAEHQPKGSARNLSDTLDRQNEQVAPGQRQWNDDSSEDPDAQQNASVRRGGEAAGGITPRSGDPSTPAAAEARAAARDGDQADNSFGDDAAESTDRA